MNIQPIHQLNNVQKARLLHALFLDEVPGFLRYISEMSAYMAAHPDEVRTQWTNAFFGVDLWFGLAADAAAKVKRYGKQLEKSSALFADQLFDGNGAIYLNHCLSEYGKQESCDPKFKLAIDLFINP